MVFVKREAKNACKWLHERLFFQMGTYSRMYTIRIEAVVRTKKKDCSPVLFKRRKQSFEVEVERLVGWIVWRSSFARCRMNLSLSSRVPEEDCCNEDENTTPDDLDHGLEPLRPEIAMANG